MGKNTKIDIMNSFLALLNKVPFEKITINDIVEECKLNRNTFYYHFNDIFDLVDELLQYKSNDLLKAQKSFKNSAEAFTYAADLAINNKIAVSNLHKSVKKPQLEKYFKKVLYDSIYEFINSKLENIKISTDDIDFLSIFYSNAILGMINDWLDSGMRSDLDEIITKTGKLFDSNIVQAAQALNE